MTKRDADLFGEDKLAIPPSCLVTVHAKLAEDTVDLLHYDVPLIGIEDEGKEICIVRKLQLDDSNSSVTNYYNHSVICIESC